MHFATPTHICQPLMDILCKYPNNTNVNHSLLQWPNKINIRACSNNNIDNYNDTKF